ncbi:MAG TPA: hypothetical protein VFI91_02320 [Longimicrobiaceae bacterium]|nr:hypothetical protein [Longimicrobiaceae bacterium]
MGKTQTLVMMALAISAGCSAPSAAPPDVEPVGTVLQVRPPPVYALLGERQELRLTSEQVAALDSIGSWLNAANAPLFLELNGEPGDPSVVDRATMVSLVEQIHENNTAAGEAVRDLLDDTQEGKVCEMFAIDPDDAEEFRERRRRSARTDSIIQSLTVWPWCGGG